MGMTLNSPKNYVEIEEEMTYLDGGVYLNKGACTGIAMYFGSGYGLIAALGYLAMARKLINVIDRWSGIAANIASWRLNAALWVVGKVIVAIGNAVIRGRGVELGWSWEPWDFGVSISVR
ncbi:MAG: hypothetical protein RSA06_00080 [Erysipelotrichaceae bacterium]